MPSIEQVKAALSVSARTYLVAKISEGDQRWGEAEITFKITFKNGVADNFRVQENIGLVYKEPLDER